MIYYGTLNLVIFITFKLFFSYFSFRFDDLNTGLTTKLLNKYTDTHVYYFRSVFKKKIKKKKVSAESALCLLVPRFCRIISAF